MGRLTFSNSVLNNFNNSSSGTTVDITTTTTTTLKNTIVFIDSGNIIEIDKKIKTREKQYIEKTYQEKLIQPCVIGANSPIDGDCSYGIGLGFGDNILGLAIYDEDF